MTIKQLCTLPLDRLEEMTPEELHAHCAPYLVEFVLDPEEVEDEEAITKKKREKKGKVAMLEISAILAQHGVKLPTTLPTK